MPATEPVGSTITLNFGGIARDERKITVVDAGDILDTFIGNWPTETVAIVQREGDEPVWVVIRQEQSDVDRRIESARDHYEPQDMSVHSHRYIDLEGCGLG